MIEECVDEHESGLVVSGLSKTYGQKVAVDDVSFACPPGSVTGLIGPNGSGKSTMMRMIVGHARASSGSATFDGRAFRSLPHPGRTVGVLLDASAQHPGRSVSETALLAGLVMGLSRDRVRACLGAVGLESVLRKRVGALSLGMRQRLGLAIAILGSPRYLVLDEPANGLDPEGILWLRNFLLGFAQQGGTVLISSHQLSEIEAAADRIVMIDRGKRILPAKEPGGSPCVTTLVATTNDAELIRILTAKSITWVSDGDGPLRVHASAAEIGALVSSARQTLTLLVPEARSLEDAFRERTSGEFEGLAGQALLELVAGGRSER